MISLESIESVIHTCVELGAVQAMRNLGVSSGELTERQAVKTYGKFFLEALKKGDIYPCRCGQRTKYYKVEDILSYKAAHQINAMINL